MTTDPALRTGPGRWMPVRNPHGVLWTDDTTTVGFQPGPTVDPAVINLLISSTQGSPTEVFDVLAGQVGERVVSGNLDTWTPNR